MTKEKLEELEALARDLKERTANLFAATEMEAFAPKGPQAADLLLRALEERKRLLEALKQARDDFDRRDCGPSLLQDGILHTPICRAAREAIAFAEEAAR